MKSFKHCSNQGSKTPGAEESNTNKAPLTVRIKNDDRGNEIAHFYDPRGQELCSILIFPDSLLLD